MCACMVCMYVHTYAELQVLCRVGGAMASEGERRHDDALSVAALRRTLAATGLLRSGIAGRDEEDDRLLLLRFLRARKMDVAKAAAMWEAMIRWRDQMEEVLAAGAAGEFPLRPEEIQIAREFHPRGYHGVDKGGEGVGIVQRLAVAVPLLDAAGRQHEGNRCAGAR